MPDVRTSALERIQVGVEVTPGTGVAANKRLMGLTRLTLNPTINKNFHTSAGVEVPNSESGGKMWSTFDYEGSGCYCTMAYILSGLLLNQSSSPYTYALTPSAVETIKTYTIETGSAVRAEKAAYGVFSSFRLRATQADVSINGNGFARKISKNQTLTAGATEIGPVNMDPRKVTVLLGDTLGGLAAVEHLEYELDIPERWRPHAPLTAATDSFSRHKKVGSEPGIMLALERQADAEALLTAAETKAVKFVQMTAPSATSPYDITVTAACMVEAPTGGDNDDVFADSFRLRPYPHADVGSGSWLSFVLTNGISL